MVDFISDICDGYNDSRSVEINPLVSRDRVMAPPSTRNQSDPSAPVSPGAVCPRPLLGSRGPQHHLSCGQWLLTRARVHLPPAQLAPRRCPPSLFFHCQDCTPCTTSKNTVDAALETRPLRHSGANEALPPRRPAHPALPSDSLTLGGKYSVGGSVCNNACGSNWRRFFSFSVAQASGRCECGCDWVAAVG